MSSWLQVLRYFDYVFTGVFTFEMIIKVSGCLLTVCCVPPPTFPSWRRVKVLVVTLLLVSL